MGIFQLLWAKLTKKQIVYVNCGDTVSVDLPRESDVKAGVDADAKVILRIENQHQILTMGLNDDGIKEIMHLLVQYQTLTMEDRKKIIEEGPQGKQIKGERYFRKDRIHGKEIYVRIPRQSDYEHWLIQEILLIEIENGTQMMDIGLNKEQLRDVTEKLIHYWHIIDRQERVLDDYSDEECDDSHPALSRITSKLVDENENSHSKSSPSEDEENEDDEEKSRIKTNLKAKTKVLCDLSYENQKRRETVLNKLHYFS